MASGLFDRYIADGFKDDCMTLLSKFLETNSARFCDFVKIWQEMRFSTIYCGLNTFAELLEFTEEALTISKALFLPPNSDISRIGALYLVYGVYTQQPTRGLAKIRMTPDEWNDTINFIDNVREFGYADANFVFHSLCYDAAFTFTFGSKEYGLERSYRRHQITSAYLREMVEHKSPSTNQLLNPVFEDVDVEGLEKIRKSYENYKTILQRKERKQGMEFTPVTPSEDIVAILKTVVQPFISDQDNASTSRTAASADCTAESNTNVARSDNNTSNGRGRQDLRMKAFQQLALGVNHLRSCLPTSYDTQPATEAPSTSEPVESSETEESQSSRKNFLRLVKKRRKIRINSPPCEEGLSPAISSFKKEIDQIETNNSPPTDEKNSGQKSQNPVRRSNRVRKTTAKMLLSQNHMDIE